MMEVTTGAADARRGLLAAWCEFETALARVPLLRRLDSGRLTRADYASLLANLRQQVVEGSRWIARAASNFGPAHEELRTGFLRHALAEHRDYLMIESDYAALGGDRDAIRCRAKNAGAEAFSAWMYQEASRPDPLHLIGAMPIIEGLGRRLAGPWAEAIERQLGLAEGEATSFLRHHAAADEDHMAQFEEALDLAIAGGAAPAAIVRTARIVARLYRLQLEEIDV